MEAGISRITIRYSNTALLGENNNKFNWNSVLTECNLVKVPDILTHLPTNPNIEQVINMLNAVCTT